MQYVAALGEVLPVALFGSYKWHNFLVIFEWCE